MPTLRRCTRLAAACVLVLVIAGCAGSSTPNSSAPNSSAPSSSGSNLTESTRASTTATAPTGAAAEATPTTATASPPATLSIPSLPARPIGPGVTVYAASLYDAQVGWALGSQGCGDKPCAAVLRTVDGGASWNSVAELPVSAASSRSGRCAPAPCVKGIQFANSLTGYAYGEAFLVTGDGGASWQREQAPPIAALAADARDVLRVVRDAPRCDAGCNYRFEYAEVGSESWLPAAAPKVLGHWAHLIRDGDDAYVLVGTDPAHRAPAIATRLLVSPDRGRSWAERPDPCAAESTTNSDARDAAVGAADGALVLLCGGIGEGHGSLRLSLDRAETFSAGAALPAAIGVYEGHVALVSADVIVFSGWDATAEFKPDVAAMGSSEGAVVVRTTDRGRTFEIVARAWQQDYSIDGSLDFSSPTTAVWVASNAMDVWRSSDAGKSWVSGTFR